MIKSMFISGLIAASSVVGVAEVSQARPVAFFINDQSFHRPDPNGRVNCLPRPDIYSYDGSYLLVGQEVKMIDHHSTPHFSLVSYRGNKCWVLDAQINFFDNVRGWYTYEMPRHLMSHTD